MKIALKNISFSYDGGHRALDDLSLVIESGSCTCLLGHNGCGKSTLARHLNGLLKPQSGRVLIGERDTQECKVSQLAQDVALSFQYPDDQICKRRVWDEVAFGPQNLGYSSEKINGLVAEALSLMDLSMLAEKNPYDLGYSERKRVAHASVFAMDSAILVFDEPTAGLDCFEVGLFAKMLNYVQTQGKTVVVISHDMDFVSAYIKDAICLENGRLRFQGPCRDLFAKKELLEDCGLFLPAIARLSHYFILPQCALRPVEFWDQFSG